MATSCEDVSARMMELLYGELPEGERAPIASHVAGCARCRAELDGFERTRALARRTLDEAPPPRARAAILAAAAQHAAAARAAAPPARAAKPQRKDEARPGFWDWLRSRWTLPTLATVGAVAVFILGSRLLLDQERVTARGHQGIVPEEMKPAAPASSPVREEPLPPPPEPSAAAPAPAPPAGGAPSDNAKMGVASRNHHASAAKRSAPKPAAEEKLAAASGKKRDDDSLDRLLGGTRPSSGYGRGAGAAAPSASAGSSGAEARRRFAPPPPAKGSLAEAPLDSGNDLLFDRATGSEQPKAKAKAKAMTGAAKSAAPAKDEDGFAPPPPPAAKAEAPAAALAGPRADVSAASARQKEIANLAAERGAAGRAAAANEGSVAKRSVAQPPAAAPSPARPATVAAATPSPAPRAPAAPAAKKPAADKAAPARQERSEAESGAPAVAGLAAGEPPPAAASAKGGKSAETPVQRADRLFADGRWAEAAAAYRELLRTDPNSADAARWRQRLAVATAADAESRPAPAAKAASKKR